MSKRVNPKKIKVNHPHEVEELAERLGVTPQTVRAWGDEGMIMLKDQRPYLIIGIHAREFLEKRAAHAKCSLEIDEVYCASCRKARKPFGMMADYIPTDSTRGRLATLCSVCESQCSRLVSADSLPEFFLKLDIEIRSRRDA